MDSLTGRTVDLLQELIRNRCVNDGTADSGLEVRNAETLKAYLQHPSVDIEMFEPHPNRVSLAARLTGTNPKAPKLCLMGHTDVVPANPDGWLHDPFGAEIIDDEIWGRGTVDMLNLTSSMAVAFRQIATGTKRYEGDIIFFGVADEEAGGKYGAQPILENHWDAVGAEMVLTEYGGIQSGNTVFMTTAEKGADWRMIEVSGSPGHGSMPYKTDNALIKAAKIVSLIHEYNPKPRLDSFWQDRVAALDIDQSLKASLLNPELVNESLAELPDDEARNAHACIHTTFSPNVIHGGAKTNIIPEKVQIEIDIRALPGETPTDIDNHLKLALGEFYDQVTISSLSNNEIGSDSNISTKSETSGMLWNALSTAVNASCPTADTRASIVTGATDGRFYRRRGSTVYGAGLLSNQVSSGEFFSRFHGHNERIDLESLKLTSQLWLDTIDLLWK